MEYGQVSTSNNVYEEKEIELIEGCYEIYVEYESAGSLYIVDAISGDTIINKPNSPFINDVRDFYIEVGNVLQVNDDIKENIEINIFPNPTSGPTHFIFNSQKDLTGKIYITNILGEKVMDLHSGNISKGQNEFKLDVQSLNPAIYLIHVESLQGILVEKFVKE